MNASARFSMAQTEADLRGILDLQQQNLPKNISKIEAAEQGFVTVEHDFSILKAMNDVEPHVIALDEAGQVVGYSLVMMPEFGTQIEVLRPMFELLEGLSFEGRLISEWSFFAVGQVCVDKNWRGQGVFAGLYAEMSRRFRGKYDFVLTEIATRNTRSMRAHEKVGFQTAHIYDAPDGENWAIVVWKF